MNFHDHIQNFSTNQSIILGNIVLEVNKTNRVQYNNVGYRGSYDEQKTISFGTTKVTINFFTNNFN